MKHLYLLLLIFAAPNVYLTQELKDSSTFLPEHFFQKNYFQLGLGNSGNYISHYSQNGNVLPGNTLNTNPYLKVGYHINLNPKNEFSTSVSINFPKINFKIPDTSINGNNIWHSGGNIMSFPNIVPSFSYSSRVFNKKFRSFIDFSIGSGFYYFQSPYEGLIFMQSENNQTIASINYFIDKGLRPFINFSIGYNYLLKNGNFIKLSMGYNHFFKDLLYGEYYLHNGTSSGTFRNKGNSVFVGLSYSLSNTFSKSELVSYSKMINPKDKKKFDDYFRKNKRIINHRDVFITNNIGLGWAINNPSNKELYDISSSGSLLFNVSIEKGIRNNFFGELSYVGYRYYDSRKLKIYPFKEGTFVFYSNQLKMGINKKVITPSKNKNLVNIHCGLIFSYINQKKGFINIENQASFFSPDSIKYSSRGYLQSQLFPLAYIGISKDILLGKGFFFNFLYSYSQGFINMYEQQLIHYSNQYPKGTSLKITMNGSYHTFQLGFKYRIKSFND